MIDREREIDQRERAVKAKEDAKKNWPSRCFPILYHSIQDEVPIEQQSMVKKFYALCLCKAKRKTE